MASAGAWVRGGRIATMAGPTLSASFRSGPLWALPRSRPSGSGLTVAAVSDPLQARGTAPAHVVQVPVDLVEFEARLLALERRLREQDARDQLVLDVASALQRLTKALGPLLEVVGPLAESQEAAPRTSPAAISRRPIAPPPRVPPVGDSSVAQSGAVEPDRLAAAQARLREEVPQPPPNAQPPPVAQPPAPAQLGDPLAHATAPIAPALAPGRRSWLLRALRRMVVQNPDAAGRLLVSLLPATSLAQIEPIPRLPGPPATVARVVVKGRLRRRLGWEMTQLACELTTVSALARLVRLRLSPTQFHAAGIRLDAPVALALAAHAIDPLWTLGHRFTLAHVDARATYLEVRNGRAPALRDEAPAAPVQTTVRCFADALLPLFAGESGVVATVEGERRPLELVQGWFQDATSA